MLMVPFLSIPPSEGHKFEATLEMENWEEYKICRTFIRHKVNITTKKFLETNNIRYYETIQNPGM